MSVASDNLTVWVNIKRLVLQCYQTHVVGVGKMFESVCLSVCPGHNSKTNVQTWYRELPWDILEMGFKDTG